MVEEEMRKGYIVRLDPCEIKITGIMAWNKEEAVDLAFALVQARIGKMKDITIIAEDGNAREI